MHACTVVRIYVLSIFKNIYNINEGIDIWLLTCVCNWIAILYVHTVAKLYISSERASERAKLKDERIFAWYRRTDAMVRVRVSYIRTYVIWCICYTYISVHSTTYIHQVRNVTMCTLYRPLRSCLAGSGGGASAAAIVASGWTACTPLWLLSC